MKNLVEIILREDMQGGFAEGNFGLEKENIRVDSKGRISTKMHPSIFNEENPYVTRDFSESQIEMITPVCSSVDEVYDFMKNINDVVNIELVDEYLWPQSNPPIIINENDISVAKLTNDVDRKYREKLANKYGIKKQLVSGVHFNFSFKEGFLERLYEVQNEDISYKEFKNKIYFKIGRNFLRYRWLLNYLTGASPVFHKTYLNKCVKMAKNVGDEGFKFDNINSVRNSACGYKNIEDFYISHNSLEEYVDDIKELINKHSIEGAKEYYSPIRFKGAMGKNILDNLLEEGVKYLEVRVLDLDPTSEWGIDKNSLNLIHALLLFTLLDEDIAYTKEAHEEYVINSNKLFDVDDTILINGESVKIKDATLDIINKMDEILRVVFKGENKFKEALDTARQTLSGERKTKAVIIEEGIIKEGYAQYHINVAKKIKAESKNNQFKLAGYSDLELSTQILLKEAIKFGIDYEVVDRAENFVKLEKSGVVEYVKQATKTGKDSYITALLMENKLVTKKVLDENGIRVPMGDNFIKREEAKANFYRYKDGGVVIKPNNTNFGIGISIFKNEFTKEEFDKAVDIAFDADSSILIEEYIEGKEYRFLVIDNEVVGILHRVPANVIGNGKSNIEELVNVKNQDPLRGKGYVTPLEKIKLGEVELMFLQNTIGKDFSYVPKAGEIVYLRENSNISTGGDSLDFTDEMDVSYKEIAIKAAKAVGARITGADIMIKDIKEVANKNNHSIIEMNFNPAIHIHCFPYKGKNRRAGQKVLELLFDGIKTK